MHFLAAAIFRHRSRTHDALCIWNFAEFCRILFEM